MTLRLRKTIGQTPPAIPRGAIYLPLPLRSCNEPLFSIWTKGIVIGAPNQLGPKLGINRECLLENHPPSPLPINPAIGKGGRKGVEMAGAEPKEGDAGKLPPSPQAVTWANRKTIQEGARNSESAPKGGWLDNYPPPPAGNPRDRKRRQRGVGMAGQEPKEGDAGKLPPPPRR